MRRLLIAVSAAMLLGSVTDGVMAGKPWDNGRLKVSENGEYLMFSNGQPFFWTGNTAWLLPQRLNRDEAAFFLSRCASAGYNVVQIQVLNDMPSYNVYGQMSSDEAFDLSNVEKPGVYGYWDHVDYIIETAAKHGIYVGMVCVWGSMVKDGRMDVQKAKTYGTFLANRYKDKKNIVWIMGGDIQGSIHTEVWDTLANTIKSIDKEHLMTFHPRGRHTSASWFNDRDWLDFNMFQSGHRRYWQRMGNKDYPITEGTEEDNWMYVDSTRKYKPTKPVLDGEPSYEDIPQGLHFADEPLWTAADVRRYAYWAVFAGACGHTYGHNAVMQFVKPGIGGAYFADGTKKPWYAALDDPGFNQMVFLKELILTFPYFVRKADQSVIHNNGTQYDRLIATRGNDYLLVYNYTGREMTVDLQAIEGKEKNVWWMSPTDGTLTYLGKFDSKQTTFRYHPTDRTDTDGVLIIVDSNKDYIAIDQQNIIKQSAQTKKDLTE